MSTAGQPERVTQTRVIALFRQEFGYRYLGNWTDREGNSNIEEGLLLARRRIPPYIPPEWRDSRTDRPAPPIDGGRPTE